LYSRQALHIVTPLIVTLLFVRLFLACSALVAHRQFDGV